MVHRRARVLWLGLAAACGGPPLMLPPARVPTPSPRAEAMHLAGPPARVWRIERAADRLDGPEADGRVGDWRLDNGRVAFIVAGADSFVAGAPTGGHLIDAAAAGAPDALSGLLAGASRARRPLYDRVDGGTRGAVAWVHASGHDSLDSALAVVTEYALAPGSSALEITTTYKNTGARPIVQLPVGDTIEWGRTEPFAPRAGFDLGGVVETSAGWLLGVGEGAAYAYVAGAGQGLSARHAPATSEVTLQELDLSPGIAAGVVRWLAVSAGADAALGRTVADLRGEAWARAEGRVVEEGSDTPVAGARIVLVARDGQPVMVADSTAAGYALWAPPGEYLVAAEPTGRRGASLEARLAPGTPTHIDVLVSRPGLLAFEVQEGGRASPAKLTFLGDGTTTRTPRLGAAWASPGGNVALTVDGRGRVAVPPGRYRVTASRGPAFTIDARTLEIVAGQTTRAAFTLKRAVDWPGLVCADLHAHAAPSPDSAVALGDRAASALAEGLDVLVGSDRDTVPDYGARPAGAARPLLVIPGDEATRDGLGHFSAWPMAPQSGGRGAPDVRALDIHQLVAALRAGPERVLQIDHPRRRGAGYFDLTGIDPRAAALGPDWDGGFDALEIFSGKDTAGVDAPLADWFALLGRGINLTAVGGSDSHLVAGEEVGWPRTCVWLSGAPTAEAMVAAIRKRHEALVTSGPFVRVSVGGRGMGQIAPAPRGRARLDVEIAAAPWIDVKRLEVIVDGQRRGKPLEVKLANGRWKGAVDLRLERDGFVVAVVRGDGTLEPVVARGHGPLPLPLAITNPIFLDRDGDGKYTPPRR